MIIEGYYVWKIYNVYSHDDDLAIFETSNVPELEDPFSFSGYGGDIFKCNLHDGWSEASTVVVLKFGKEDMEELRIISPYNWEFDEDVNTKEKLNIEDGFFAEGFTELKITDSKKFNSKSGKFSFRNHNQGHDTTEDLKENCIKTLPKNDLELGNILLGWDKKPVFVERADGGFSFTWRKGVYEAFNVSAVKPKTIYKAVDVEVNFPCCSKKQKFNTNIFKSQWGIKKLYCEDCDKYHTNFEQYFTFQNEKIDFNQCGIGGYKDEEEEVIYGSIIRPQSNKNDKIDFISK